MLTKLTSNVILSITAAALAFVGMALLGVALAGFLAPYAGILGGYAIAGCLFLAPLLLCAIVLRIKGEKRAEPTAPPMSDITRTLMSAVARETPWIAALGAGAAAIAEMLLNRRKAGK